MPHFISPRTAGESDIVGIGGPLTPETLRNAYAAGIFPWPMTGCPLLWFCPLARAVLEFDRLHIPRRLARIRKNTKLSFTRDQAFNEVIAACRRTPRSGQSGTWITAEMLRAYQEFHRLGYAHSVETWDESGQLVGGVYGVLVNGYFSGESMFHLAPNASKLALLFLIEHLEHQGIKWLDCQMLTPHMIVLGAHEISRDDFLDRIEQPPSGIITP